MSGAHSQHSQERAKKARRVLMADDDPEDVLLFRDAFKRSGIREELQSVSDGQELVDFLHAAHSADKPLPDLILLDLNMPRKDGREALAEIKGDPLLRSIPTIVLTTSSREEDVQRCYELGANSYVRKPSTFDSMVDFARILKKYWLEVVELPPEIA